MKNNLMNQEEMTKLNCPACGETLSLEQYGGQSSCSHCSSALHIMVFPALAAVAEKLQPEQTCAEDQASCYYHPGKQAVVPCAHCGRFLCTLCDLELAGQHICSACLSSGKDKQAIATKNKGSMRYDMVALAWAFWPLLLFPPLAILGAPLAFYYTIKYYTRPVSIVPIGRWRFWLASLLALGQLASGGFFAYYLITM